MMRVTLDQILKSVRRRVLKAKRGLNVSELADQALSSRSAREPFLLHRALERRGHLNIIAEFKRASPSKGVINDTGTPSSVAQQYDRGGTCAVSVLTEPEFFRGSLDDLKEIRRSVSLPVLRKDFVIDDFQIYEAALAGADAILLIVAALSQEELVKFVSIAEKLRLDAIVEVHTADELRIATGIGSKLIGVNNRDLRTFNVTLDVSHELAAIAPADSLLIAESGLQTRNELLELQSLGYAGFLIGETLMRGADAETSLRRLLNTDDKS